MRHSGDADAFAWDDAPTGLVRGPRDARPAAERGARLPDGRARRRVPALAALLVVVVAGTLVTRADGGGLWPDVLYASAIHLTLIAVLPRLDALALGAVVLVWCTGVELLQITGLPALWALHVPLSRLLLGSAFDPVDLGAYAVGVLAVILAERLLRGRARSRDGF